MSQNTSEFASVCAKIVKDQEFHSLPTQDSKIEHIFKNIKPLEEFRQKIFENANKYRENHGKSIERCQSFRTDAENFFLIKRYSEAIRFYTYALLNAPFPTQDSDCKELQKCYTSRAVAFFQMGDFPNALFDTDKSLFLGKTNQMLFQKAFCLRSMDRYIEAKCLIDGVVSCKDYYKLDEEPELLTKFQDLKVVVDKQYEAYGEGNHEDMEDHPDYDLWIDSRFDLKEQEDKGRCCLAKEAIPKDSLIIAERLENSVLSADNLLTYCCNCFKFVGTQFWPCIWCNEVVFCNRLCHDRGLGDFHYHECGITGLIVRSPFYGIYRSVTRNNAEYAFKRAAQEDRGPFDLMNWVDTFYGRDTSPHLRFMRNENNLHFDGFLSLLDHSHTASPEEDAWESIFAIETALFIQNKEAFKPSDDKTFIEFIAFLVKMFRKTKVNSFHWGHQSPHGMTPIGSCMAIMASFFNHSCTPNVFWTFKDDKMLVRALRDLSAGEEMNMCYGPNIRMPLPQRQTILRNNYNFICKCDLCKVQVNQMPALECLKCEGPVIYLPNSKISDACMECDAKYDNICEVLYAVSQLRLNYDHCIKNVQNLMGKSHRTQLQEPLGQEIPEQDPEDDSIQSEIETKEESVNSEEEIKTGSESDSKEDGTEAETETEPEAVAEPEVETESQKEAKREAIDSNLQSAEKWLKALIRLHYKNCDEIFDLELQISILCVENDNFEAAVPHFQRILNSIDWSKCGKSCRHWESLLYITNAYYDHLKDESVSEENQWKQCFQSFSALKQSYKTLKSSDPTKQWTRMLTIGGKPVESADTVKRLIREKKDNFIVLKDLYKKMSSA